MSEVKNVRDLLLEPQYQLRNPVLNCLIPDEHTYQILFMQRGGRVAGSPAAIANSNSAAAQIEFIRFFELATEKQTDLAVTPEYSCPWSALEHALSHNAKPKLGALWIIGCESTTIPALVEFAQRSAQHCIVVHDTPESGTKNFLDPVAYIFQTQKVTGEAVVVVLAQFKTEPMAEPHGRLEPDNLICGRFFYRFRNDGEQSISLITMLCSDSLALVKPENAQVWARIRQISPLLLIHLQLNLKPRDPIYTGYRYALLQQQNMEREIFTANWAAKTEIVEAGQETRLTESMSAWFLQSDALNCGDARLASNHKYGGYPTYIGSCRSFAYVLNFDSFLFQFRGTKVSQVLGTAQGSLRTGPEMLELRRFDTAASAWMPIEPAPDGCEALLSTVHPNYVSDGRQAPINTERLILLSCGRIGRLPETPRNVSWPQVEAIDTCRLGNLETIQRITFGQDQTPAASTYRNELVARFRAFEHFRLNPTSYPVHMDEFRVGSKLNFKSDSPYTNLENGKGQRACVAYAGADVADETIPGTIHRQIRDALVNRNDADPDNVVVWYRDLQGHSRQYPVRVSTTLNRDDSSSVSINNVDK